MAAAVVNAKGAKILALFKRCPRLVREEDDSVDWEVLRSMLEVLDPERCTEDFLRRLFIAVADEGLCKAEGQVTRVFLTPFVRQLQVSAGGTANANEAARMTLGRRTLGLKDFGLVGPDQDLLRGHPLRGISVRYLANDFLADIRKAGFQELNELAIYAIEEKVIRAKGADVICPRDSQPGCAFVDAIYGPNCAGIATLMLSYTWGYKVVDIVECLTEFCETKGHDPERTYVWICCLCVNQHRVKGQTVPFSVFQKTFAERVERVGHVVAMMAPWDNPAYIKRVWCDFEMYTAIKLHETCRVDIVMPQKEAAALANSMVAPKGLEKIWTALGAVDVETAEASSPDDREMIMRMIKEDIGVKKVNQVLKKHLQTWIVTSSEVFVRRALSNGDLGLKDCLELYRRIGNYMRKVGMLDRAEGIYEDAQGLREKHNLLETKEGAELLLSMGALRASRDDQPGAIDSYEAALAIHRKLGTVETQDGAKVLDHLGAARRACGDLEKSLANFSTAQETFRRLGCLESEEGGYLASNIGVTKTGMGDHAGALHDFEMARDIYSKLGRSKSPDFAKFTTQIGEAQFALGRAQEGLQTLEQAQDIYENICMTESPANIYVLCAIGNVKRALGDVDGALAAFAEAESIGKVPGKFKEFAEFAKQEQERRHAKATAQANSAS